ncbi:MAG: hypothetical protein CME36_19945 [unclassified Hahellaceae]|nr:hypothetical protein [Hahellaceae bacterium]
MTQLTLAHEAVVIEGHQSRPDPRKRQNSQQEPASFLRAVAGILEGEVIALAVDDFLNAMEGQCGGGVA